MLPAPQGPVPCQWPLLTRVPGVSSEASPGPVQPPFVVPTYRSGRLALTEDWCLSVAFSPGWEV